MKKILLTICFLLISASQVFAVECRKIGCICTLETRKGEMTVEIPTVVTICSDDDVSEIDNLCNFDFSFRSSRTFVCIYRGRVTICDGILNLSGSVCGISFECICK